MTRKINILLLVIVIFGLNSCNESQRNTHFLDDAVNVEGKEFLSYPCNRLNELSDDQLIERIQYDYSKHCLAKPDSLCTVERDAFRITLICIATANNWINREIAVNETLWYLEQFKNAKHIQGILPRTFDRVTGENTTIQYGKFGCPYDVVGTAFLCANLLFIIRQYYNLDNSKEKRIRQLCNEICDRVNWDFAYDTNKKCFTWFKNGPDATVFDGKDLKGEMDETFFMQLLVLCSGNWSYGTEAYEEYISNIFIDHQYGHDFYSTKPVCKLGYLVQPHIWFDLRNINDQFSRMHGMTYFKSVQEAIQAQIDYSLLNPGKYPLYGDVWGFYDTYSPISNKWIINGMPNEGDIDEGTISIDAVLAAICFRPEPAIHCIRTLYENYKDLGFYTENGIATSINIPYNTVSDSFKDNYFPPLTVLLLENYRTGLIWKLATSAPEYKSALEIAGFTD